MCANLSKHNLACLIFRRPFFYLTFNTHLEQTKRHEEKKIAGMMLATQSAACMTETIVAL